MPNDKNYKASLTLFINNLNHLHIQNLILDLRNNGGGKSQNYFAGFFINQNLDYKSGQYASIHDATYKKHFISRLNAQYIISKLGSRIYTENERTYTYIEPQIQYQGQLYVLMNGNTVSAASNLTSILKEWSDAIIVGEESGGGYKSCNTGGGILQLPNSKIRIAIRSIKFYNHTANNYKTDGVYPDYLIKESSYFDNEYDQQLDYILDELIQKE